jgi:hypothetical protein
LWDYTYQAVSDDQNKHDAKKFLDNKLETQLPLIFVFTAIHDIFSYLVITGLDAMTIRQLRLALKEEEEAARSDENKTEELRSISMIVLSSLSNFLLRSPELISCVFFYVISLGNHFYTFKILCYSYDECISIVKLANVFYILSISFNFFFYYFFNRDFKLACHWHVV